MREGWKRRLDVAEKLDKRPDMCWAALFGWATEDFDVRLTECRVSDSCRDDYARNGRCWCGKLPVDTPR